MKKLFKSIFCSLIVAATSIYLSLSAFGATNAATTTDGGLKVNLGKAKTGNTVALVIIALIVIGIFVAVGLANSKGKKENEKKDKKK